MLHFMIVNLKKMNDENLTNDFINPKEVKRSSIAITLL